MFIFVLVDCSLSVKAIIVDRGVGAADFKGVVLSNRCYEARILRCMLLEYFVEARESSEMKNVAE